MLRPSTTKIFSRVFRNNPKYSTVQPLADLTAKTSKLDKKSTKTEVKLNLICNFLIIK